MKLMHPFKSYRSETISVTPWTTTTLPESLSPCFVLASQATEKVHIRGFVNEPTTYLYSANAGLVHNA